MSKRRMAHCSIIREEKGRRHDRDRKEDRKKDLEWKLLNASVPPLCHNFHLAVLSVFDKMRVLIAFAYFKITRKPKGKERREVFTLFKFSIKRKMKTSYSTYTQVHNIICVHCHCWRARNEIKFWKDNVRAFPNKKIKPRKRDVMSISLHRIYTIPRASSCHCWSCHRLTICCLVNHDLKLHSTPLKFTYGTQYSGMSHYWIPAEFQILQ